MRLSLSDEQEMLRDASARFIEASCPLSRVRQLAEDRGDPGQKYQRQAAELGWYAMLVPEDLGGGSVSGSGLVDCTVIAVERGRQLQPLAFAATNAVLRGLSSPGCAESHLEALRGVVAGEQTVAWALASPGGDWTAGSGVEVVARDADTFLLTGRTGFVHDADRSEWLLVAARARGHAALSQFLVASAAPGITIRRLDSLDITRTFCEVALDGVEVTASSLVGPYAGADALIEDQFQVAVVLTLAESIGAMEYVFDLALDYAKSRIAFGRPIGSFQAVKHLLADTAMYLETANAMLTAATDAVAAATVDAAEVVSMAKAFISDAGIELTQNCFQVFGGIGYTWEHDQHLYLRRLAADAALYGDPAWHRERICQLAGL